MLYFYSPKKHCNPLVMTESTIGQEWITVDSNKKKIHKDFIIDASIPTDILRVLEEEDLGNNITRTIGANVNLEFSDKTMQPHIILHNNDYDRDILFLNIPANVKNHRFVGLLNDSVYILKYMIVNGMLCMAVAFSSKTNNPIVLDFAINDKEMESFIFTPDPKNKTIDLEIKKVPLSIRKGWENGHKVSRFVPNKPTHLMFIHKQDLHHMASMPSNMGGNHNIQIFSSIEQLSESAAKMKQDGYCAATLYVPESENVTISNISNDIKYKKAYGIIFDNFDLIHILLTSGRILKVKKKIVKPKQKTETKKPLIGGKQSVRKPGVSKFESKSKFTRK